MSNIPKILELSKSPREIAEGIAAEEKRLRRRQGLTQRELAARSGVSLGSLKRFEQTGEVSFVSLICIARALGSEDTFSELFNKETYDSIEEVIREKELADKRG